MLAIHGPTMREAVSNSTHLADAWENSFQIGGFHPKEAQVHVATNLFEAVRAAYWLNECYNTQESKETLHSCKARLDEYLNKGFV